MAFLSSNPPARDQRVSFAQLVELLAPALGREKSQELISSSAKSLGYAEDRLNLERSLEILSGLGAEPGIVGVATRLAKARLLTPSSTRGSQLQTHRVEQSLAPTADKPLSSMSPSATQTIASEELVEFLAHSLGTEKSREVIGTALSQLGIPSGRLTAAQAHTVLELTAKADGIVGVTSRFAKARLSLKLKQG